jgi:hypothetical protein
MLNGIRTRLGASRPSPALVVAFLALLVALGGTASALSGKNSIDNNDLKKNSVDSANIAKNQAKGDDVLESSLSEVPSADNGSQGYALISQAGLVTSPPAALNITSANVTNPSAGVYCFNGLAFTPRTITLTGNAENANAQDNFFVGALNTDNAACPGVEQASVESRDDDPAVTAAVQNASFYVVFG